MAETTERQEPTPWEAARTRYLEQLDPEEQTLFTNATIENLFYSTSNAERSDRSSSKVRKAIEIVQPLVEKIESYGKAMDTYTNIAPTFVAPIWGSLRVILVIAQRFERFYERMTDTLGRIGDILPRLRDYERIFSQTKHPRLKEALTSTYLDVIELCMEFRTMIKAQQKSLLKRVMKPLSSAIEKQFKDAEVKFRLHKKTVDREAETCHMIEAADARALVLRDRHIQEMKDKAKLEKKVLGLLSTTSSREKHKKLKSLRHGETGNWIFSILEYQKWTQSIGSSVLCCYGIPGCGKTVLASSVIDSMVKLCAPKAKAMRLAFHYCDHADKRTLEPVNILGTCIRSIFEDSNIPTAIIELIMRTYAGGERSPEPKEVFEILTQSVDLFDEVILAIDGIDEAKEVDRQLVFAFLISLIKHHSSLKLFVSCREDVAPSLRTLKSAYFSFEVSEAVLSLDIGSYIQDSVESLLESRKIVLRTPELKDKIVAALINGAKGMFLWVKFQLDDLCNAESDAEIKSTLQNLPKDLSETYDRLLDRIVGTERQALVRRMFQLIICARYPLTSDEICEGIAFDINDDCWNQEKVPTDILRLVRASGNLVVIDRERRTLQLSHYTVQQHILNTNRSSGSAFRFTTQEANSVLGEVCLAYLNFSDFETQLTTYVDNKVTANMAIVEKVVPETLNLNRSSFANGSTIALSLVGRAIQNKSKPTNIDYSRYIPTKNKDKSSRYPDTKFHLLEYARQNWLWHTAHFIPTKKNKGRRDVLFYKLVWKKQLPFPFRPWNYDTDFKRNYPFLEPFGWSLVTNHCPLLHLLLKTDADFKPWDYIENAARWFFYDENCVHVSSKMMRRLECCSEDSWTGKSIPRQGWLYWKVVDAIRRGNLDVLRLCLQVLGHKRDFGIWQLYSHLVLEAAANCHLLIIDLILDRRNYFNWIDCNLTMMWNGNTLNALDIAVLSGSTDIASRLLDHDWRLSTPLNLNAASAIKYLHLVLNGENLDSHLMVLNTLKVSKTDPDYQDFEDEVLNALITSASAGNLSLVKSCWALGGSPLQPDKGMHCAYMRAIKNGQLNIVEFFIARGCGFEANVEGLPLNMAASTGRVEMVKYLIAKGASYMEDLTYAPLRLPPDLSVLQIYHTPLWIAAVNGHRDLVHYFITICKDTPLPAWEHLRVCILGIENPEPLRLLLNLGLDELSPTIVDSNGASLLWTAAAHGSIQALEILLEHQFEMGCMLEKRDHYGQTPLLVAIACGRTAIVLRLIDAGANLNVTDAFGNSALILASQNGYVEIVDLLLLRETPVNTSNTMVPSPLTFACVNKRFAVVERLLTAGADANCRLPPPFLHLLSTRGLLVSPYRQTDNGREEASSCSVLVATLAYGTISIAQLLIAAGADVNGKDESGFTVLTIAVANFSAETIQFLISAGADVNARDGKNRTPLMIAVQKRSQEMVERTALIHAVEDREEKIIRLLVDANADINTEDTDGYSVLKYAVKNSSADVVEFLVKEGAQLQQSTENQSSILRLTVEVRNLEILKCLSQYQKILDNDQRKLLFNSRDFGSAIQLAIMQELKPLRRDPVYARTNSDSRKYFRAGFPGFVARELIEAKIGQILVLLYRHYRSAVLYELGLLVTPSLSETEIADGVALDVARSEMVHVLVFGNQIKGTGIEEVFLLPWKSECEDLGIGWIIKFED